MPALLLDLEPLDSTDELIGLDEMFFGDDSNERHDVQNCFVSQVCQAGSHTDHCIATQ